MVEKCLPCQAATDKTQRELLKSVFLVAELWLRVDLYGPGPGSGGEYLLVVQCLYSRFPAAEIVSSSSHKAIIPALYRIMSALVFLTNWKVTTAHNSMGRNSVPLQDTWVSNLIQSHLKLFGLTAL